MTAARRPRRGGRRAPDGGRARPALLRAHRRSRQPATTPPRGAEGAVRARAAAARPRSGTHARAAGRLRDGLRSRQRVALRGAPSGARRRRRRRTPRDGPAVRSRASPPAVRATPRARAMQRDAAVRADRLLDGEARELVPERDGAPSAAQHAGREARVDARRARPASASSRQSATAPGTIATASSSAGRRAARAWSRGRAPRRAPSPGAGRRPRPAPP